MYLEILLHIMSISQVKTIYNLTRKLDSNFGRTNSTSSIVINLRNLSKRTVVHVPRVPGLCMQCYVASQKRCHKERHKQVCQSHVRSDVIVLRPKCACTSCTSVGTTVSSYTSTENGLERILPDFIDTRLFCDELHCLAYDKKCFLSYIYILY